MKKKILIVEDDLTIQKLMKFLLAPSYEVVAVKSNGMEALLWWREHSEVDLVITDIEMPLMGGFELIRRIRNAGPRAGIPIIVVSSTQEDQVRNILNDKKIEAFVNKPVERDLLLGTVQKVMETSLL